MIKNLLNFMKNPESINLNNTQTQKSPQEEFFQISSSLDNFYSLLKTSITKNEILKEYDSLDITIIEFINKHGRNSYYGEKAVELSKKLSQYYNYFKENISLYLDEISEEVPEPTEPSKIDYNLLYEDLRSRLNAFKDNIKNRRYSNEEVENYVILFNEEIKDLVKTSEEDFKLKFVELKNKLVNFYKLFQKQYQQELQQTIYKNEFNDIKLKINEFKSKSDSIKYLIKLENKTEHQILEINNSLLQINQDFNKISSSIENSDIKEKLVLSEELTSIYKDLDNFYFNYINKPEIKLQSSVKLENPKISFSSNFLNFLNSLKQNKILKLKTSQEKAKQKQNIIAENTVNFLTQILNNIEIYNIQNLKQVFSNNYNIYETHIISTDYSLLVKSLLDDIEKNIKRLDEEEKLRLKRIAISKESYKLLNKIVLNLENYSLEELNIIYEKNLETFNNFSKFTILGIKINYLLMRLNNYINIISSRKSIQENLSKIFFDKLEKIISNYDNYSVNYLSNTIGNLTKEYNNYYLNSELSKNISYSLQTMSNTLSFLKILVLYINKDIMLTEKQRILLRNILSSVYANIFSLNSTLLFNRRSKKTLRKLKSVFNIEIKRKLMLEDLNNKIISLNLSNNEYINLLINNLVSSKNPESVQNLKDLFIDISADITKKDKESLNNVIIKLTELTNTVLPLRKKSLFELKTKLS